LEKKTEEKKSEYNPEKRRIIGSRKAVLVDELNQMKKSKLETIQAGDILTGTVSRITDFGAFVDLGGIDGLIHVTELSWGRVKHPSEIVKSGQSVEVYVLSIDKEKERISLSLKKTVSDPWESITENLSVGSVIEGKVMRLAPFGAFVEIAPGVDGLVHISQISDKRVNKVEDVLKAGDRHSRSVCISPASLPLNCAIPSDIRRTFLKSSSQSASLA
jgi:4-hydroxy-3-methylbut-2-enyl diphosphate reductase